MAARAITALTVLLAAARAQHLQPIYDLTDEQYYEMPQLFALDEWAGCRARADAYCVGTFELVPEAQPHPLFDTMKRYSANWVDNFNHTRLHRGTCLPRSCAAHAPPPQTRDEQTVQWFTTCINASTSAEYNLSAYLYKLDYCEVGATQPQPLTLSQKAFAGFVLLVLVLVAIATLLDVTLADDVKKEYEWAVSCSLGGSWRVLHAPPPSAARTDLACFDGLRVFIMMVVIIEHVTWITTHAYISDTRTYEQLRRSPDAVLLSNSTLVVQIFFMMSSFLLAHKVLQQGRKGDKVPIVSTFIDTMVNRFIRVSPSYLVVVWFAGSWWERAGSGPLWAPLVREEAAACRRKWWPHLFYLHNVVYPDDKCLIQTWYLAADMQLYALCLALTLVLQRWRRAAVLLVAALLLASVAVLFALAYVWRLVPTLVMHRPESVRVSYDQDLSFNVLYQSPLGNLPGALGGLLLAHLHHALLDHNVNLNKYPVFVWSSVLSVPAAVWWVLGSPLLAEHNGPPGRLAAAALAAVERPVFSILVGCAVLGAMNGVPSTVRSVFSWRGWAAWARLSFGALLLHMPLNKALVAARPTPSLLDRPTAIVEWFGVAAVSYLAALVLALLVELPAQRLHRAVTRPRPAPAPPAPPPTDKTDL